MHVRDVVKSLLCWSLEKYFFIYMTIFLRKL